uniref:Transient receptor potential cation channel subfamily A member 1 homolog n=1 Tax=Phallusia mammillata TaxID=59560 RepID=A0A6F9DWM6_9ASCI|nr:transient receptor potential cation channel subfamily A member 1 homolog [Phallusia mammillata]
MPSNRNDEIELSLICTKQNAKNDKEEEKPLENSRPSSSTGPMDTKTNSGNVDVNLHEIAITGNVKKMRTAINQLDSTTVTEKLNLQDEKTFTPLHHAAENTHIQMCQLLVDKGTDTSIRDKNGGTAFHHLFHNLKGKDEDAEIIQLIKSFLDKTPNVDFTDKSGHTLFHYTAFAGYVACAELLINKLKQPVRLGEAEDDVHNLSVVKKQLNMRDNDGGSPLHYAAKEGHLEMCRFLIQNGADINSCDKKGKTALHQAVSKEDSDNEASSTQVVKYLLEKEAHFDMKDELGRTPFYYAALNDYVTCTKLLIEAMRQTERADGADNDPSKPSLLDEQLNITNEKGCSLLHLASDNKQLDMCELLVENGAAINLLAKDGTTPFYRLVKGVVPRDSYKKHHMKILKLMLQFGANVDAKSKFAVTPLHMACANSNEEIVRMLLQWKADVTCRSDFGWNAMDHAIIHGSASCARALIESPDWKDALRNITPEQKAVATPMRRLIRGMPDIAEEVFNKCIINGTANEPIDSVHYMVSFHYEFLDDDYSCEKWFQFRKEDEVFEFEDVKRAGTAPYHKDPNFLKTNHPLHLMVLGQRKNLLSHPLVVSLLNHKWKAFGRTVFGVNLLLYLLLMVFFNLYMLTMPPPYSIDSDNVTSSCVAIITEAQPLFGPCYNYNSWGIIAKYFVIVFAALGLLKELYQLSARRFSYFKSTTNLFEISLYILAILTVYSDTSSAGPNHFGVREDWQWQIGAVSIFLSWMVLIMFIRSVPTFGIFVLMFNHVLRTFTKFFFVFVLFILGFALSFHCLLQNQYAFRQWWNAVIKTSLMMIGEFQFEDIFVAEDEAVETGADIHTLFVSRVNYRAVSYILFVIFVIIMSIIIMNLLVGLAVDDIKEVQKNAELKGLAMKVKLILDVEYSLPQFIRRRVVPKSRCYYPNKYSQRSDFIQWLFSESNLDYSTINETINPGKNERGQLEKRVESLDQKLVTLGGKVDSLQELMSTIASHLMPNNDDRNT